MNRESLNGYKPLELTPRHIFVSYQLFSYNDLGLSISGLETNERALNCNHMNKDLRSKEEQEQQQRWVSVSARIAEVSGIPREQIDKDDVLRQFRVLSKERMDMLSNINFPIGEVVIYDRRLATSPNGHEHTSG